MQLFGSNTWFPHPLVIKIHALDSPLRGQFPYLPCENNALSVELEESDETKIQKLCNAMLALISCPTDKSGHGITNFVISSQKIDLLSHLWNGINHSGFLALCCER